MVKCIHHWYLGASNKGTVHAKCLKCGAEKDYQPIVICSFGRVYKNKKVALHSKPRTA